ncbi:Putative inorganic phosphate cotransporter [Frankliniella fusca]|uniref:Inorganic phosphate cotransporter n=1 Tax=Frankliniella fusca TaxID=407009 RepID=A0AAE1I2S2_9NEOP|nr:Putative inorganic phosphate cotransporter [Frankliniella fusca]
MKDLPVKEAPPLWLLPADTPAPLPPVGNRRNIMMWILATGAALAYMCRVNMSLCIVAMTTTNRSENVSSSFQAISRTPRKFQITCTPNLCRSPFLSRDAQVYDWSQSERGYVLSAFFWGYVVMQVPGATLSNLYGPRWFIFSGVAGSGLLTLLTPLAASWGPYPVCALRVLQGLCQGLIFPCIHYMLGRWAPPVERSRCSALVMSGPSVGTLAAMAGVGLLCASPLGWPSGFYVPGGLAVLWGVLWWWQGANSPDTCTRISAEERAYIKDSLGAASSGSKRLIVPWLSILRTPCVWAIIVVHSGSNFGHWLMLTQMPNYMKTVLQFDIKENGLVSSLPYLTLVFTSILVAWVTKVIANRQCLSIVATRKIFNSIGHYGMGLTFMALAMLTHLGIQAPVAVALLTVAVSLEAALLVGFLINHVDLSPNFGGAMFGLSNCIGNVMGIIAPLLVSVVVGDDRNKTLQELATGWSYVFLIGGCVYLSGNTIFLIFGRADVQPWNYPKDSLKSSKDDEPAERHELLHKRLSPRTYEVRAAGPPPPPSLLLLLPAGARARTSYKTPVPVPTLSVPARLTCSVLR